MTSTTVHHHHPARDLWRWICLIELTRRCFGMESMFPNVRSQDRLARSSLMILSWNACVIAGLKAPDDAGGCWLVMGSNYERCARVLSLL
jgi:hypothetical protein